jgi:hypothetical protein
LLDEDMAKTSFHIQHNTNLGAVQAALSLATATSRLDLYDYAERIGFSDSVAAKLVLPFLRQIGLLTKEGAHAQFGDRLLSLRDERPELLGEALHARLYVLHLANPGAFFSLAYALLCDWLTDRGEFVMDGDGQAELVAVVVGRLAEKLELDPAGIAFSKTSVQGAMHWLEATDPSALRDGVFRQRHAAPTLAVLWAVDTLYRTQGISFGTRLSLGEENETRLAHMLLLDPEDLASVLEVTARTEGSSKVGDVRWLALGTEGGFGRWLLLSGPCPIGAFAPGNVGNDPVELLDGSFNAALEDVAEAV